MKVCNIIFMTVFVTVLYQLYFVFSDSLSVELAIALTAWLMIVVPTLWFKYKSDCNLKKRASKIKNYFGNQQLKSG